MEEKDTIKGVISCGFEFDIPVKRFENYKILKMLKESDEDPTKVIDVMPAFFGEQEEKLIEALGGDPTITEMCNALREVFDVAKKNNTVKNS